MAGETARAAAAKRGEARTKAKEKEKAVRGAPSTSSTSWAAAVGAPMSSNKTKDGAMAVAKIGVKVGGKTIGEKDGTTCHTFGPSDVWTSRCPAPRSRTLSRLLSPMLRNPTDKKGLHLRRF
jgi:hypothetical protein